MGLKNLLGALPFLWGSWDHIEHKVAWAEAYLHTKWHLDASSRLATIDMGRKLGDSVPFCYRGNWVPIQHNVAWDEAYLFIKWHLDPSISAFTPQPQSITALWLVLISRPTGVEG